jgi:Raf kinase inhibitor-like YbhB/YbcL family protein
MKTRVLLLSLSLAVFLPLAVSGGHTKAFASPHAAHQAASDWNHEFRVTSTTFENDQMIPAIMVFNGQLGSTCTGGNESPELSWTPAGRGTKSYVVALFDVSANFTHWGAYNIPADVTELPEGAGSPSNTQPLQVFNDAGIQGYSGPCPPPGSATNTNGIHRYVFTVYALDRQLDLIPSPDFPPSADALYRAMIGHVIDSASIAGFFNCNNGSPCS